MSQLVTCEDIEKHLKALIKSSVENSRNDAQSDGRSTRERKGFPNRAHQYQDQVLRESSPSAKTAFPTHSNPKKQKKNKNKNSKNFQEATSDAVDDSSRRNPKFNPIVTDTSKTFLEHQLRVVNGIVSGKELVELGKSESVASSNQEDHRVESNRPPITETAIKERVSVASVLKESGKQKTLSLCEDSSSDSNASAMRKKKKKIKSKKHINDSRVSSPEEDEIKLRENEDSFTNQFHYMIDKHGETISMTHKDIVKWLDTEYITCLKKQSERFPDATFYCQLCNYHCNMSSIDRHLKQMNHMTMKESKKNEALIRYMPQPTEAHVKVLSKVLEELCDKEGMSENDLRMRQEIVNRLNKLVQKELPDVKCKFQLFGSSISGIGLKSSNINIDLIVASVEALSVVLSKLRDVLDKEEKFTNVVSQFEAKSPSLSFLDSESGLQGFISWNNTLSLRTAKLLGNYAAFDPRVKILCVAVRYWAKLCEVDEQEKGTLPAHSFLILMIYYLQQTNPPVLPVLHELAQDAESEKFLSATEAKSKWESKNKQSVGFLWIDFLRFYSISFPIKEKVVSLRRRKPFLRTEKKWEGKVIAIEDPMCRKRNLSRAIPNQTVYRYIFERLQHALKYFGIPQLKSGPLFSTLPDEFVCDIRKYSKKPSLEFNFGSAKNYTLINEKLVNLMLENEISTDLSNFKSGINKHGGKHEPSLGGFDLDYSSSDEDDILEDQDPDLSTDQVVETLKNLKLDEHGGSLRTESESSDVLEIEKNICEDSANANENTSESLDEETLGPNEPPSPCEVFLTTLMSHVSEDDLVYHFDKDILTEGKSPPLWCKLCQQKGHLKNNCPSQILPDLIELPPLTNMFENILTETCKAIVEKFCPKETEVQDRKNVLIELQKYIREIYADANLELFGSSCNGFGFTRSDMDICLTFTNNKTGEGLDFVKIIENLAIHLKNLKHLHGILPITTAKVPIVKFSYHKDLECDISLYNTLAQHNTRMLKLYCEIDERVQLLGYTLKYFAKLCDIGDASRGSLSSYAYILMVLHFLQQRNPPVIPVLQELYDKNSKKPEVIVDGYNAWFFEDLPNLEKVWPHYGKNTESVGELWLGLLRYYTETFNFKDDVISVKQSKPLTRFEKVWNSKSIAIEDPFDLSHNLGVGLSQNMNTYIMKALIRGREVFGVPLDFAPLNPLGYLFDQSKLVLEAPPNDRGCRICSKIGHKMKDCPNRKNGRNRGKGSDQPHHGVDRNRNQNKDNQQLRDGKGYHRNTGYNRSQIGGNFNNGSRQANREQEKRLYNHTDNYTENVRNLLNSAVPKQYHGRQMKEEQFQAKDQNLSKTREKVKIAAALKLNQNKNKDPSRSDAGNPGMSSRNHQSQMNAPQARVYNEIPNKVQPLFNQQKGYGNLKHMQRSNFPVTHQPSHVNNSQEHQKMTYTTSLPMQQGQLSQPYQGMPHQQPQLSSHKPQQTNQERLQNNQHGQIFPPHIANNLGHQHYQQQAHSQSSLLPHHLAQQHQMLASQSSMVPNNQFAALNQRMQYAQQTGHAQNNSQQAQGSIPGYLNQIVYPPGFPHSQQNAYSMAPAASTHTSSHPQSKQASSSTIPDEAQRMFCRPPMPSPFN